MMTLREIAEAEARANAATPGPWCSSVLLSDWNFPYINVIETPNHQPQVDGLGIELRYGGKCTCFHDAANAAFNRQSANDADFIAAARTDVPALCETARRAIELLHGVCNYGVHTRLKSCGESCPICCAQNFLAQVTEEPPK